MRVTPLLIALTGVVTGVTLAATPAASAANGVFGGSTRAGEAIVWNTDRAGKRVRSAVLAWEAACDDGSRYVVFIRVTATKASPGFDPEPRNLVMTRNRRGRFAGSIVGAQSLGAQTAVVSAKVTGRLRRASASGTLTAYTTIVDGTTGSQSMSCETGRVRWTASRAPGRIYGGSTSQGEPFVVRLDARRRVVRDLLFGWHSQSCTPEGFVRFPERFGNFAVNRRGRWGDSWQQVVDGGAVTFSYKLAGALRRTSARGTLAAAVNRVDDSGATDLSCESGTISWKAKTG